MTGQLIGHSEELTFGNTTEGRTHELLAVSETHEGKRFMFVQASAAITQYAAVGIDENGQAANLTDARALDSWKIGVAPVAIASGSYGWVQIYGRIDNLLVKASCAADVALFTSATAGHLDDTATAFTKISGIVLTAARAASDGPAPAFAAIEPWADIIQ